MNMLPVPIPDEIDVDDIAAVAVMLKNGDMVMIVNAGAVPSDEDMEDELQGIIADGKKKGE